MINKELLLCKAKQKRTGEWVQGSCIDGKYIIPNGRYSVMFNQPIGEAGTFSAPVYEIDPTTLCRCTGLKDKNGKLIWERDIVKDCRGYVAQIVWCDGGFERCGFNGYHALKANEQEVIGNAVDNPELLEGGAE